MISFNVPNDDTERREWIKYQLRVRGVNLSSIAREHGVSRHASILALRSPYPKMERAIAEKLGVPPAKLWPERYDSNGIPNRRKGRPPSGNNGNGGALHADKKNAIPGDGEK